MTKKKRIWLSMNVELYEKYKKIVLSDPKHSINQLYRYIEADIIKFDKLTEKIEWNARVSKTLLDFVDKRYPSQYQRKVITVDDEMYYHIRSMRRRGYDITGYINYSLYCRVRHHEEHGE